MYHLKSTFTGCAVPSTFQDYGEENHNWSYLCNPSERALLFPATALKPRLHLELDEIHFLDAIPIILSLVIVIINNSSYGRNCESALI